MVFVRAVTVAAALIVLAGCSSAPHSAQTSRTPATSPSESAQAAQAAPWAAGECESRVRRDALPTWARAGFSSEGAATMPHVVSSGGDMIAALFAYPTRAWPGDGEGDGSKILWISRVPQRPSDPLRIDAYPAGSQRPVHREVSGGPGPSLIALPRAGCWRLTLSWSGHSDTIDLQVAPPEPGKA